MLFIFLLISSIMTNGDCTGNPVQQTVDLISGAMSSMKGKNTCAKPPAKLDCNNECEEPGPKGPSDSLARVLSSMIPQKNQTKSPGPNKQLECVTGTKQDCAAASRNSAERALMTALAQQTQKVMAEQAKKKKPEIECGNPVKGSIGDSCEQAQEVQKIIQQQQNSCKPQKTTPNPEKNMGISPQDCGMQQYAASQPQMECNQNKPSKNNPQQSGTDCPQISACDQIQTQEQSECGQSQNTFPITPPQSGSSNSSPQQSECGPSNSTPQQSECEQSQNTFPITPPQSECGSSNSSPQQSECGSSNSSPQQSECGSSNSAPQQSECEQQSFAGIPQPLMHSDPMANQSQQMDCSQMQPVQPQQGDCSQQSSANPPPAQDFTLQSLPTSNIQCQPSFQQQKESLFPSECSEPTSAQPTFPKPQESGESTIEPITVEIPLPSPTPATQCQQPPPSNAPRINPVELIKKTFSKLAEHRYKPQAPPPIKKKPEMMAPNLSSLSDVQKMCCKSDGECPCMPVINIYPVIYK